MKRYDCRTGINISIMKSDYDLFREKCKAMDMTYSQAFRKFINDFNETTFVLVEE